MTKRGAATRDKIAITIPRPLLVQAREEVADGRAPTMSALLTEALSEHLKRRQLADILASWDAEDGGPTEEDDQWARNVLGI